MTTQLAPDRFGLPPPIERDLVDADRVTGWIVGNAVGFRGFAGEGEATHAAWVAHRALARRLARTHRGRPVPVDIEPLAVQKVEGRELILASGKPIAELIPPGSESRTGASFGFELSIPTPTSELEARALAYLMYRTLRKSGIRWAMWRPEPARVSQASAPQEGVDTVTRAPERVVPTKSLTRLTPPAISVLTLASAAVLALGVASIVTMPLTAAVLAGLGVSGVMLFRSRRLR